VILHSNIAGFLNKTIRNTVIEYAEHWLFHCKTII